MRVDEAAVEMPNGIVGQVWSVLGCVVNAVVGAGINTSVIEGYIGHVDHITLVSNVIGILDFLLFQVKDHNAEAAGHVGQVTVKEDVVDAFVAHDVLIILDVAHVVDVSVVVDEVDIGVGVGHKELALAFVVADGADADVRQTVDFVEDIDGVVLGVVVKQLILRGSVNLASNRLNANHFLVRQVGAPIADGNAVLGERKRGDKPSGYEKGKKSKSVHNDEFGR